MPCYIQCGSIEVREYCRERGYRDLFERTGAEFIQPGCGACINAGPGNLHLTSPYSVASASVAG